MSVRVLHVSNISPYATKEQIQTLFAYVGRIEEFKLYPSDFIIAQASQQPKFAYVKFENERGVEVGQHLTNTVFLDRALVCIPGTSNAIPEEETAIQGGSHALPGQRQLPPHISNQVQDIGDGQKMIVTIDPNFASLGLPAYPPLPPTTEPSKVEEIRRTVYVGNLPKGCDGEELLNFFNACIGEVMYLRMAAGNEYLPCDYAYVEFSQQTSVPLALQNSDSLEFQGRILRIQHSKVAIIKPQRKTVEQSLEEVEEAIRGGAIGGTMDLGRGYSPHRAGAIPASVQAQSNRDSPASVTKKRSRSRSRSHSNRRSRDRSRTRRRSRSRSRSSSYSRRRRRRSRSRTPEKSSRIRSSSRRRSRSKKRSVDRSKKKKRSRSRERSTRESSTGKLSKRDKEREKERERSSKKDKEASSKKERKRSRSRSAKKDKAEREEKSSKKSKQSLENSPKKAKKEVGTDTEPASTRTDAGELPLNMDISPKKPSKKEPVDMEEESLRERLLERVKIKQQQKESDD